MPISNIQLPPTWCAVGNPIGVRLNTTGDYVDLKVQTGGLAPPVTFSQVGQPLRQYPDANGRCTWNLAPQLRGALGFAPPSTGGSLIEYPSALGRTVLITAEEYLNGVLNANTVVGIIVVYLARMPKPRGQAFLAEFTGKYLTDQPRRKAVTSGQPEWLTYIPNTLASQKVRMLLTLTDGSTQTVDSSSYTPPSATTPTRIAAGHDQRSLSQYGSIESYTVQVLRNSDDSPLTEVMTYELSCQPSDLDRYYVFENQRGGYDTLRTTGRLRLQGDVQGNRAAVVLDPFAAPTERSMIDYSTQSAQAVEQATGYLPLDQRLWLQALLNSEDAYRIGDAQNIGDSFSALRPIQIERGTRDLYEDANYADGITFSYREEW